MKKDKSQLWERFFSNYASFNSSFHLMNLLNYFAGRLVGSDQELHRWMEAKTGKFDPIKLEI